MRAAAPGDRGRRPVGVSASCQVPVVRCGEHRVGPWADAEQPGGSEVVGGVDVPSQTRDVQGDLVDAGSRVRSTGSGSEVRHERCRVPHRHERGAGALGIRHEALVLHRAQRLIEILRQQAREVSQHRGDRSAGPEREHGALQGAVEITRPVVRQHVAPEVAHEVCQVGLVGHHRDRADGRARRRRGECVEGERRHQGAPYIVRETGQPGLGTGKGLDRYDEGERSSGDGPECGRGHRGRSCQRQ